jgi:hypothetical protein
VGTAGSGTTRGGTANVGGTEISFGGDESGGAGGAPPCVPGLENCVTPEDEDCDGLTPPCEGAFVATKVAGNKGAQMPSGMAVNAAGDVVLSGTALGGIDFGPPTKPIAAPWTYDAFLVDFDSKAAPRWDLLYTGEQEQSFNDVAVAADGDLLVTGDVQGAIDFGQGPLQSQEPAAVLARFDANGQARWGKMFSGNRSVLGMRLVPAPEDRIAAIGEFEGKVDFGGGPIESDQGYLINTYVALFDGKGNWIWNQRIGGDQTIATGVAVDPSGAVLVGGWFVRYVDFGAGPVQGVQTSVFIAKYAASGALQLHRAYLGSGAGASIAALTTDSAGDFIIGGSFDKKLDLGAGPMTGSYAAFVAKLDGSGNVLWSKSFDSTSSMSVHDVALDPWGNVLVCGLLNGTTSPPLSLSAYLNGGFVLKLDPDGNVVWARAFDGTGERSAHLIASDALGNVYVAGTFSAELDVGKEVFLSSGQSDVYVVKLSP